MEDKTTGGKKDEQQIPWWKQPIFLGASAFIGTIAIVLGVFNSYSSIQKDEQAEQDRIAARIYADAKRTAELQDIADDVESVESATISIHQWLKEHCQGHRDQDDKWSDCTEL